MRILFASTGGRGHLLPILELMEAARAAGSEVALLAPRSSSPGDLTRSVPLYLGDDPSNELRAEVRAALSAGSGAHTATLVEREYFGRHCTAAMLAAAERAFDDFRPDVLLRETCEYSGAVCALRRGVPNCQLGISPARGDWFGLRLASPVLEAYRPGAGESLAHAPYLTRLPASLDPGPYPDIRRYREPTKQPRPLPNWWDGDPRPLVYMTLGSVAGGLGPGARLLRSMLMTAQSLPARVLLSTGLGDTFPKPCPPNVHLEGWVGHVDAAAASQVVVCHGGTGTVYGTVAVGVPLVVVPMFADQATNGASVSAAGAGIALPMERVLATGGRADDALGHAIREVAGDDSYRRAAAQIAAEMSSQPIPDRAWFRRLVTGGPPRAVRG